MTAEARAVPARWLLPRYQLLGVEVTPVAVHAFVDLVAHLVRDGARALVANHNLHSVYLFHHSAAMRRYCERASIVFIDGMPLVGIGRLLGYPLRRSDRITCVDWLPVMMDRADTLGWRVFLLGGRPGVAERARRQLSERYRGATFEASHGMFQWAAGDPAGAAVLQRINEFKPDLLLVGMGMPRQEAWLLDHEARLEAGVMISVGALMDYVVGRVPTPPRWTGRVGLEWAFRLATTPRRVAWRYLVEPWFLLPLLGRDLWRRPLRRVERS